MGNIEESQFNKIQHFSSSASFLIYDAGQKEFSDYFSENNNIPELKRKTSLSKELQSNFSDWSFAKKNIKTDAIFVGLNRAGNGTSADFSPWKNFHRDDGRGYDYKIFLQTFDTGFEGNYMTDLFKNSFETDSNKVKTFSTELTDIDKFNIDKFNSEIEIINPKYLFVWGVQAQKEIKKRIKTNEIQFNGDIYGLTHYSMYGTFNWNKETLYIVNNEFKELFNTGKIENPSLLKLILCKKNN